MSERDDIQTCEAYREAVAAEPGFEGGGEHLARCPDCREFHEEMQQLDARIARALSIRVPALEMPDLDEVDTSNVAALPTRRRRGLPGWFAVAASVLVAVVLGWRFMTPEVAEASLADQVVEHLSHEMFSIKVTDQAVSDDRLARVVPVSVASLDHDAGLITYAQSCIINGHSVPHLVMQGEHGPVTILLMPAEKIEKAQQIDSEHFRGVILPVGDGSIAIVGNDPADLERLEKKVRNSVAWTT